MDARQWHGRCLNHISMSSKFQTAVQHRPHHRKLRPESLALYASLPLLALPCRARAESRLDYRYEDYQEDAGRIAVSTQGAYFGTDFTTWLALRGNFIYDSISGATPTGAPPLPGETTVAKATISDIRRAGFLEMPVKLRNHSLTPQFAYSKESDYESVGVSLNHSIELNEKNTTLTWGISQSFDRVLPNLGTSITEPQDKNTTDVLIGVMQLLGPNTVLSANVTVGYSTGFLDDPYKRVLFDDFPYFPPFPYTVFPENRPDHKLREVFYIALQHFFEKLNGALETSYRFHHDDFGVMAHTLSAQWNQKIGKHVLVSPLLRYHTQSAADFYATHFPGDPTDPITFPIPEYYSADYRLSDLHSITYGVLASIHLHNQVSIDLAYKRYIMKGTDGVTADDQYPKAHIWTAGMTIWF